jgi:hypothetical protein
LQACQFGSNRCRLPNVADVANYLLIPAAKAQFEK